MKVSDEMVNRFLRWPLPMSVSSDLCVTKREMESSYPPKRIGTNLLTADEARAMLEYVLAPVVEQVALNWIQPANQLPPAGDLIVFKVASGAVFIGSYGVVMDYPKFIREDGHGQYTPKVVRGWLPIPSELPHKER